jgi:hypothetical protein
MFFMVADRWRGRRQKMPAFPPKTISRLRHQMLRCAQHGTSAGDFGAARGKAALFTLPGIFLAQILHGFIFTDFTQK